MTPSVTMLNWDKKSRYISHKQKRTQAWETVYCLTYSIVLYHITDWITAHLSRYVLCCQILAKTQPNISQFHSFLTYYGQIIHQLIRNNLQKSSLIQKIISCRSVVQIKINQENTIYTPLACHLSQIVIYLNQWGKTWNIRTSHWPLGHCIDSTINWWTEK